MGEKKDKRSDEEVRKEAVDIIRKSFPNLGGPRIVVQDDQGLGSKAFGGPPPAPRPVEPPVPPPTLGEQAFGRPPPPAPMGPPGPPEQGAHVITTPQVDFNRKIPPRVPQMGPVTARPVEPSAAPPPGPPPGPAPGGPPAGPMGPPGPPDEQEPTPPGIPGVDTGVGPGAGGGGYGVIPGGMLPEHMSVQTKLGKPVDDATREMYGLSTGLQLKGAEQASAADKAFYEKKKGLEEAAMQASTDARLKHAQIQHERDLIVQTRLAEIQALNDELVNEDPQAYWKDRGVLAQIMGAIAIGAGTFGSLMTGGPNYALNIINAGVERELNAQRENNKLARTRAGQEQNLLNLHMERLNDADQAADATRLALYDSLMHQLEAYKAEHGGQISDAAYNQIAGGIMGKAADIRRSIGLDTANETVYGYSEKYHSPQVFGGGAGGATPPAKTITLPDGTSYEVPSDAVQKEAIARIDEYTALQRMNNEIKKLRSATAKLNPLTDYAEYTKNIKLLNDLEQRKLKRMETADKQGVLREGEYERAQALTGHATAGLGKLDLTVSPFGGAERRAADAALDAQTDRWSEDMRGMARSMGTPIVERGLERNKMTGTVSPTTRYTGQFGTPRQHLAPPGFKSAVPGGPHGATPGDRATESSGRVFSSNSGGWSSSSGGKRSHHRK